MNSFKPIMRAVLLVSAVISILPAAAVAQEVTAADRWEIVRAVARLRSWRRAVECSESIWEAESCARAGETQMIPVRATKTNSASFLNIRATFLSTCF